MRPGRCVAALGTLRPTPRRRAPCVSFAASISASTSSRRAPRDQLDRVGVAVDDPLEELLAVLVGGEGRLRPAAGVVEHHRQARVGLAEALGDLALHPLRQRRRGARGRDRDRQRAGADDRGQDEVAERRHVDDVDEHRAPLGVLVDADVDLGVVGRGDREEGALEVGGAVLAPLPARSSPPPRRPASSAIASGATRVTAAPQASRPSTFSSPISPPPTTRQRRPVELQAGDVEGRLEHAAHARLVADPLAELADAVLAGVGLGGHGDKGRGRRGNRRRGPAGGGTK